VGPTSAAVDRDAPPSAPELSTVADDEVVVHVGSEVHRWTGLAPDTETDVAVGVLGRAVRTLPRRGELLARVATVNDVHFGETVCGHIDGIDWPTFSVEPGEPPYPETMNAAAVAEISDVRPDAVVVKGDLTSNGTRAEYDRFLEVYGGAFGDRLVHVRGNHESFHSLPVANEPTQERVLPGVVLAVLDTSPDQHINGHLSAEQLDWLDELGARADRPVLVFGHPPAWNEGEEPRSGGRFFSLQPDDTEALVATFARRPALLGYFAGHTHRNRVQRFPQVPEVPFVEVASVKEYPGTWAEYRVYDGLVLQIHRRLSSPAALRWSEVTRGMFAGTYTQWALGADDERSFAMWSRSHA
jgi:predicted phosphodiesterase